MGSSKKQIVIYKDEGVDLLGVQLLQQQIGQIMGHDVRTMSSSEIIDGALWGDCLLLIMPGGRDVPYLKALGQTGINNIKHFVLQGGSYLGICAGAYFACDTIEFQKGGPLQVVGERYLKFYPQKGIGPALAGGAFSYNSPVGALITPVCLARKEIYLYYNGGCFFSSSSLCDVDVIASFKDRPDAPAIISSHVGLGRVVLSGVHFEYDYEHAAFHAAPPTALSVGDFEQNRISLFRNLIDLLIH
jgi:biotin--protein ligase